MSRRDMLLAAGGLIATAAAIDAFWWEPNHVRVTRHRLGATTAATPGGPGPIKIAQITDMHLKQVGRYEESVAEVLHDLAPHIIVFTGDSIDQWHRLPVLQTFLALLDAGVPKFAITGNWDRWSGVSLERQRAAYAEANGTLLVNETALHRHGTRQLSITGLDDLIAGAPDLEAATEGHPTLPNRLLLAHCPHHRDLLDRKWDRPTRPPGRHPPDPGSARTADTGWRPDYVLSGHTHGGQVAPLGWAPVRPRGSGPYVSGWYTAGGPPLYVSRGVGTSMIPVRLGAPPEVALFEWSLS